MTRTPAADPIHAALVLILDISQLPSLSTNPATGMALLGTSRQQLERTLRQVTQRGAARLPSLKIFGFRHLQALRRTIVQTPRRNAVSGRRHDAHCKRPRSSEVDRRPCRAAADRWGCAVFGADIGRIGAGGKARSLPPSAFATADDFLLGLGL